MIEKLPLLRNPKSGPLRWNTSFLTPVLLLLFIFSGVANLKAGSSFNESDAAPSPKVATSNTSMEVLPNPELVRSFRISDATTEGKTCFPTAGTGVLYQRQECSDSSHYIWRAGTDLVLNEYDDDTATITGTVIDEVGTIGQVNIGLANKSSQGTTWNARCYVDGISDPRTFYTSFSGNINVNGTYYSIALKNSDQHYILADGAGFEPGQFGFGAWTGGSFGECTEWFGTLTPIDISCDLSVDAGDDVAECTEENIELTATYSGSNECLTGCAYPVLDAEKCSGTSEEVYLFPTNGNAAERKFQATAQHFETFSDGTARYTATASNGVDVIEVNMLYSGRTTDAPANSPKEHSCGAYQDVANFEYYTTLNGTIESQNHGTFYASSMGPSFQIGEGADVERPGFGASGWFNLSGGNGYYDRGDVNITLGSCVAQGTNEASFFWSTIDGTIVGSADQETIEVSESGTYTVTVTNCDGCEATDEVEVTIVEKLIVGDFVFEDADRDGLRGANETGVDGLTVTLYNADGTVAGSTTTANGGEYTFEVCPGEYYVIFGNVPNGFAFTNADAGDDALDSDANANGRTPNFVITDSDNTTIDAGIIALCNIDPEISGDGQVCSGDVATLTASGGNAYLWSTGETSASIQVAPSATTTYTVSVSDSSVQDCSETLSITVAVSERLIVGDFVFEDTDSDGLRGANETGVDGLTVTLYNADGTLAGSTTTANGGEYTFEVCPGEYYVIFDDVPNGFAFTNPDAGDDALDSDADANGRTANFVITDSDNTTIDAGLVSLCNIDPIVDGKDLICAGEVATLQATGGDTYLWSTGETSASIQVAPEVTTTYTVTVTDSTMADCSAQVSFTVTVESVDIDAGPDVTIAFGDSTTLTVSGVEGPHSIIWSTGETTASIMVAPEVTTTYSVTVVNWMGCFGEASVTVNVNNECGIMPAFKILPRDQPGVYAPGNETAACIGDDLYLWMYTDLENLNDPLVEDYTDWTFTYEFPNGDVIVQNDRPNYPGNHRAEKLDLTQDDFGQYKISWVSPTGCTGTTIFTLNFPDEGCGDNGTRTSDFFMIDAVYPIPAAAGSAITLEVSTRSASINSLAAKSANNASGKTPELVSRKETIHVRLYNFHGRQVGATQTFDVEQGKVKVYYQLGNLATGNYIIKIDGDLWTDSKQIIVE